MLSNYSFVRVVGAYKTAAVCSYPTDCIGVIIEAIGAPIRYTLDGTNPTPNLGMRLLNGSQKELSFEDFLQIKFCRSGGVGGTLAVYFRT